MKSVYVVTYERYDTFQIFEILEVFKTKELAEKYLESDIIFDMMKRDGYVRDSFHIIEKMAWGE